MNQEKRTRLIISAEEARERAYAPYSGFSVGAALLTEEGEIFTGCNIENSVYPAGLCAERAAIFSAVAAGYRRFQGLAVTGGRIGKKPEELCFPCGMCLQVMSEFCDPEFPVIIFKDRDEAADFRLKDFLPHAFASLNAAEKQQID